MDIVLRLKSQQPKDFKEFYIMIPDLHYRKSMMHSILAKYCFLGVQHLARLSGYVTDKRWHYLVNSPNISKSFAFVERLCDSMRIVHAYEFIRHLKEECNINLQEFQQLLSSENQNVIMAT